MNGLTQEQVITLKNKLLSERNEILTGSLKNSTFEDNFHAVRMADDADQAEHESEQALQMRFRNRELLYLKKIDQALERIENGTYGICDETGENIGFKRLLVRPTAELSLEAKENQERLERQSIKTHKSVGQSIRFQ